MGSGKAVKEKINVAVSVPAQGQALSTQRPSFGSFAASSVVASELSSLVMLQQLQ
jgi:hypothetical protein